MLFGFGDAKFVMMMRSTPAPACMMIAGIDAHVEYCFDFVLLLGGAGSFHDLLCAPHPSHIADNRIGDAGCIALSSSLVHLFHLKVLYLGGKFVVWSGAFVVILGLGADFVLLMFGMWIYEGGGLFGFVFFCFFCFCSFVCTMRSLS